MTNVEVKEISGDIVEWYYGMAKAIENREKYHNKIQGVYLLLIISIFLILFTKNVSILPLGVVFAYSYSTSAHYIFEQRERIEKNYEDLMEYKKKYTLCGVSQIFVNSWIWGMYPEASITLKFQDKENKVHYINIKVRRKRNKYIKVPTLCVWDMTLYLTKSMEKELLIRH